jgi:hypothetical protein
MSQLLTMSQFAELAGVQRPVVTMWRKRPLDGHPFPMVDAAGRITAEEALAWLQATGRGKPAERALALLGMRTVADLEAALAAACLLPLLDGSLGESPDAIAAARQLDPNDQCLVSELTSATEFAEVLRLVDLVSDSTFGAADAYSAIRDRLLRQAPGRYRTAPRPELVHLIAELISALTDDSALLVDVLGTGSAAIASVIAGETGNPMVRLVTEPDDPAGRDALRRYWSLGVEAGIVQPDQEWLGADAAGVLAVAVLPSDIDSASHLLDELDLQLVPGQTALVLGSAALLCDPSTDQRATKLRDGAIRDKRLRAVVRLPQGIDRAREREHTCLWVLRPIPDAVADPVPLYIADASGRQLGAGLAGELVCDLAAVLGPLRSRRQLTVLTGQDRAKAVASSGSLVRPTAPNRADLAFQPADAIIEVERILSQLGQPCSTGVGPVALSPTGDTAARRPLALGAAVDDDLVQLLSGTRLPQLDAGTTPVWDNLAVTRGKAQRFVDLLDLVRQRPRAQLSAPGDVIFTVTTQPAAVVDANGGAVVAYPARILRVVSDKVSAHLLASTINQRSPGDRNWRAWQVPLTEQAPNLDEALDDVVAARKRLTERLKLLNDLETQLCDAVTSGTVQIDTQETSHG